MEPLPNTESEKPARLRWVAQCGAAFSAVLLVGLAVIEPGGLADIVGAPSFATPAAAPVPRMGEVASRWFDARPQGGYAVQSVSYTLESDAFLATYDYPDDGAPVALDGGKMLEPDSLALPSYESTPYDEASYEETPYGDEAAYEEPAYDELAYDEPPAHEQDAPADEAPQVDEADFDYEEARVWGG